MAPQFTVEMSQISPRAKSASKLADWQALRGYIENIDCPSGEKERLTLWAFSEMPESLRREIVQQEHALPNAFGFHGASHHEQTGGVTA